MRLAYVSAAFVIGVVVVGAPARAADPPPAQASIKGEDVMGDKGRTGPDGWSWAPQTRDQAPDGTKDNTAKNGQGAQNSQGGPSSPRLSAGQDPGTPATQDAHGPGTMDGGGGKKP